MSDSTVCKHVLYQSRTVSVQHRQASKHRLVLLHVFSEWKMGHQRRHDL